MSKKRYSPPKWEEAPEMEEWEGEEMSDESRQCFPSPCNPQQCFPRPCFPRPCFPRPCFPRPCLVSQDLAIRSSVTRDLASRVRARRYRAFQPKGGAAWLRLILLNLRFYVISRISTVTAENMLFNPIDCEHNYIHENLPLFFI
ncbi:MAG: hypothetical protein K0Q77_486 [Anaerosporomusa subterranea]|nr:hypothetical protein [Anaerosporomusa subterranea]